MASATFSLPLRALNFLLFCIQYFVSSYEGTNGEDKGQLRMRNWEW